MKEVSVEEVISKFEKMKADEALFKDFRKRGGHGLSQDNFLKLIKKGKTMEDILALYHSGSGKEIKI